MLLDIRIQSIPFLLIIDGLSLAILGYLVLVHPTRHRLTMLSIAGVGGAAIGLVTGWLVSGVWYPFDVTFTPVTRMWIVLVFLGVAVAIASFWSARWWHKAIAGLAIVLFTLTGAVGVNVDFGMFSTVRAALGLEKFVTITPPKVLDTPPPSAGPLWETWVAPANLPSKGRVGSVSIPPTNSKFVARDALLYLPPAALTAEPPKLPLLIMLSGQPGAPNNMFDSVRLADLMDSYAQSHNGLAPIVLVPDQLGAPDHNPMCVDSPLGNSATYLTVDVPDWVRSHLNVEIDPRYWAIGGYSQGGTCSIQLGAGHPELFGNIIDAAGELEPHVGSAQNTIDKGFGGSAAAYDAAKPLALLATHAPYSDSLAIFGIGQNDSRFTPGQARLAEAARTAGMDSTLVTSPGSAHDWQTVRYTVDHALPILYLRWGLSG